MKLYQVPRVYAQPMMYMGDFKSLNDALERLIQSYYINDVFGDYFYRFITTQCGQTFILKR